MRGITKLPFFTIVLRLTRRLGSDAGKGYDVQGLLEELRLCGFKRVSAWVHPNFVAYNPVRIGGTDEWWNPLATWGNVRPRSGQPSRT